MTSRQQRRAAERLSRKQPIRTEPNLAAARVAEPTTAPAPASKADYHSLAAAATLAMLLPDEDAIVYRAHLQSTFEHHNPEPGLESQLVQRLADLQWRLRRIDKLEAALTVFFRRKYVGLFPEVQEDSFLRTALLDAHIHIEEGLHFKRLHIQEAQLRRFYKSDMAALAILQSERRTAESAQPASLEPDTGFEFSDSDLLASYTHAAGMPDSFNPLDGFEFSSGIFPGQAA